MRELMRICRFTPLNDGRSFVLRMYDLETTRGGKNMVGYEFAEVPHADASNAEILFSGDDYGCSPMHAIDSDESVCGLMGFLTLRKGDTDAEYFEHYTPRQLAWTEDYACEVISADCSIYEDQSGGDDGIVQDTPWEDCEVNE